MKLKTIVYLSLVALVASLTLAAHAQTFSVIHMFDDQGLKQPFAGVTLRDGTLYGTTQQVGAYQITHSGSNWNYSLISTLPNGGFNADSRVVFGPDGHPYGTTQYAYDEGQQLGYGLVYDLVPPITICKTANCEWKENVLYFFQDRPDGAQPSLLGDLVWDKKGNIYGTTSDGGANGEGAVYEMKPTDSGWKESVVYSFTDSSDGGSPSSGVIFDTNGNLFGTDFGGLYGYGTVFELTNVNGVWKETVVYDFQQSSGAYPSAGLLLDKSGNLYGATSDAGNAGGGTVFELSPSGDTWIFTLLYNFSGRLGGFCGPFAPLTMDGAGNLYGTTNCDGANGFGNIFKLTKTQNGWVYSSLHDFTGGDDGKFPVSNVTIDADGTLYGTAWQGGSFAGGCLMTNGCGVVWMIKP